MNLRFLAQCTMSTSQRIDFKRLGGHLLAPLVSFNHIRMRSLTNYSLPNQQDFLPTSKGTDPYGFAASINMGLLRQAWKASLGSKYVETIANTAPFGKNFQDFLSAIKLKENEQKALAGFMREMGIHGRVDYFEPSVVLQWMLNSNDSIDPKDPTYAALLDLAGYSNYETFMEEIKLQLHIYYLEKAKKMTRHFSKEYRDACIKLTLEKSKLIGNYIFTIPLPKIVCLRRYDATPYELYSPIVTPESKQEITDDEKLAKIGVMFEQVLDKILEQEMEKINKREKRKAFNFSLLYYSLLGLISVLGGYYAYQDSLPKKDEKMVMPNLASLFKFKTKRKLPEKDQFSLTHKQINAASYLWAQLLTGEVDLSSEKGFDPRELMLRKILKAEAFKELSKKDPFWSVKFMHQLDLLIQENKHDQLLCLSTDYIPNKILKKAAKNTNIPEIIFPRKVSVSFHENGNDLIVNGKQISADEILANKSGVEPKYKK